MMLRKTGRRTGRPSTPGSEPGIKRIADVRAGCRYVLCWRKHTHCLEYPSRGISHKLSTGRTEDIQSISQERLAPPNDGSVGS